MTKKMPSDYESLYQRDYLWPIRQMYYPRDDLQCTLVSPYAAQYQVCAEEVFKAKLGKCPNALNSPVDQAKIMSKSVIESKLHKDKLSDNKVDEGDKQGVEGDISTEQKDSDGENEKIEDKSDVKLEEIPENLTLGKCPKMDRLEVDKTDACLKKLLDDNPKLLDVIKKVPLAETIKKFNMERLKSTYQVDFLHMKDNEPMKLPSEPKPCPLDPSIAPKFDCRLKGAAPQGRHQILRQLHRAHKCEPNPCAERVKIASISSKRRQRSSFDDSNKPKFMLKKIPPWSTEYRDEYNTLADDIIKYNRMSSRRKHIIKQKKLLKPEFDIAKCSK